MSRTPRDRHRSRDLAAAARADEESLRARWDSTQAALIERFEAPLQRAGEITRRTLGFFPVRVWRHFLQHNGFVLAAGVSYQALFACFATVYVVFSIVGLWLGGSQQAVAGLIDVINQFLPGLIETTDSPGVIKSEQVQQIATGNTGVLSITGLIALITVVWTAIGAVTFTRRAVRDIFGLAYDARSFILLKAGDFAAAIVFGIALVIGAALSALATWALSLAFSAFGLDVGGGVFGSLRVGSVGVTFGIDAIALAALVRFLTGTQLRWRTIWPGALVGAAALTVLQLGTGLLLSYTPSNPLLATFAIFVGLLLWFRIAGIIILVAAAWIAVSAQDDDEPLLHKTEAEKLAEEHAALLLAAHVRLRTAHEARAAAPWFRRWHADRAVQRAQEELAQVEAAAPAPSKPRRGFLLD